jgi:hypothetical protein
MIKVEEAALREEIVELRKQLSALAIACAELATKTPTVIYQPYPGLYNPWPWPYTQWPTVTFCNTGGWSSSLTSGTTSGDYEGPESSFVRGES